ncbi:MAG: tetratricopeptide repeat protein [Actinomycetia bacterium]|nr:tetratricopeptide repeat protein [Actinomycetes bacterium]
MNRVVKDDLHQPTLQGLSPRFNYLHLLAAGASILAVILLIGLFYRASMSVYGEKRAIEHRKKGESSYARGYFEDAQFEFRISSQLGSPQDKTYFLLGKTDLALGRHEEAVDSFQMASELDPSNAEYHFTLGATMAALGDRQKAIGELEAALDQYPNYIAARLLLAQLFSKEDRLKEAVDHYEILAGLGLSKARQSEVHVAIAKLLIKQKRRPRAQHVLQTAWYLDRGNREAWRLIMEIGRGKGRVDEPIRTTESTSSVSSKVTSLRPDEKIFEKSLEVRGEASAKFGAVTLVELTYDGGHSWHNAKPVNGRYDHWVASIKLPASDGERHVFYSRAIGSADVPERPGRGVSVVVDNSGPPVIPEIDPPGPSLKDNWYAVPPQIILSTLESGVPIFYKWNRGDYQVYGASLKAPIGRNRLLYFTRDKRGNESPVRSMIVKVKIASEND